MIAFGSVAVGLTAALDTGGPAWFATAIWKDGSLWDEPGEQE